MRTSLRGDNFSDIRERNSRLVLRAVLRHGPISRQDLSHLTGLVPATISGIVNRLIGEGLLQEVGNQEHSPGSRGGRRKVLVDLNPRGAAVFAVGPGIYSRTVALVGPRGEILGYSEAISYDEEPTPREGLDWMERTAKSLLAEAMLPRGAVVGTGIAAEGLVDPATGVRTFVPYRNWRNVPIRRELEERLGVPAVTAHIAHAAAMGEVWFGSHGNAGSILLVSLATTVSSATVVRHEVLQGHRQAAGAIGHVVVREGGDLCVCGKRGCLETVAGESAIAAAGRAAAMGGRSRRLLELSEGRPERIVARTVARAAAEGDLPSQGILAEAAAAVGAVVATLVTHLSPEVVVVDGNVPTIGGEAFLEPFRRAVAAMAFSGGEGLPAIELSSLNRDATTVGAAALALERFFYSPQLDPRGREVVCPEPAEDRRVPIAAR